MRHSSLQTRTDLARIIKSSKSKKELVEARGLVVPFLRDTLVGLNYAYYEPPGAQILLNNPLFVRSHDFSGEMAMGGGQSWRVPHVFGSGLPAGGGAHLAGSLADLPFVLAEAEQDFIVPENVQALIWHELVPGLVSSATLPRWWGVTRNELHAVTLYQRTGEELLAAAAQDEKLRHTVLDILAERMAPQRSEQVGKALSAGAVEDALSRVLPGETFYLAAEFRQKFPGQSGHWGKAGEELEELSTRYPAEVSWKRLSDDFGVPHPALAQSYSLELLKVKPFPAFMGYSSRLLAESWDSNNLYWARLADELGYSPAMMNRLVPELTYRMVEKIFATDFEDWPAMLRAMRETGDEFRRGKITTLAKSGLDHDRSIKAFGCTKFIKSRAPGEEGGQVNRLMAKRFLFFLLLVVVVLAGSINRAPAQETESETKIRVEVDMVQLNVAVMDRKGNYVTGLRPSDFVVTEDGITQKVATFGEGNEATRTVTANGPDRNQAGDRMRLKQGSADPETSSELGSELGSMMAGANVFILFDTSNYMYRGFVFAQDAIAEFVRSLDGPDRVAFYSYSRDLSRGCHSHRRPLSGAARSAYHGGRRRCRFVQRAADDRAGRGPEHGPESDRGFFQRAGQCQHGAAGRCG